ncbi:MAG: FHA domain-containing protein [Pseudomonadota bacterium]
MSLLSKLLGRRDGPSPIRTGGTDTLEAGTDPARRYGRFDDEARAAPPPAVSTALRLDPTDRTEVDATAAPAEAPVPTNIWDMEPPAATEDPADGAPGTPAAAGPAPTARVRRTRTRLIGFETSQGDLVDPFSGADPLTDTSPTVRFPVGWLVVRRGPGRGHGFALTSGMAQIGRGDDQAIQLDFGDTAISRDNHAAIVYDAQSRSFLLGHGGKANIVRLNDRPVLSNETLSDGDEITIGETTLLLRTLCGSDFSWEEDDDGDDTEGREDVEIT